MSWYICTLQAEPFWSPSKSFVFLFSLQLCQKWLPSTKLISVELVACILLRRVISLHMGFTKARRLACQWERLIAATVFGLWNFLEASWSLDMLQISCTGTCNGKIAHTSCKFYSLILYIKNKCLTSKAASSTGIITNSVYNAWRCQRSRKQEPPILTETGPALETSQLWNIELKYYTNEYVVKPNLLKKRLITNEG